MGYPPGCDLSGLISSANKYARQRDYKLLNQLSCKKVWMKLNWPTVYLLFATTPLLKSQFSTPVMDVTKNFFRKKLHFSILLPDVTS